MVAVVAAYEPIRGRACSGGLVGDPEALPSSSGVARFLLGEALSPSSRGGDAG
jgi:hypothetical protein